MKLRIRGNSIRLRLTQSEVLELAANGCVQSATSFGDGELRYGIASIGDGERMSAAFRDNEITIYAPAIAVSEWANSEQVGIEAAQTIKEGKLHILIEKDFACLKPRHGEDDADTFANPLAAGNG
jgi:hypothetical protein